MLRWWKQVLFWGEIREQIYDLQIVSASSLRTRDWWRRQLWQFGNSADPAVVLLLFLLTPKGRYSCFCWGTFLLPPPGYRNHAGILTGTCEEVSLLLAALSKTMSRTQILQRIRMDQCGLLIFTFSLFTPSWIYYHPNFLDGQTDNRIYMKGFMWEITDVSQLLNRLGFLENESLSMWCKSVDVSELIVWVTDSLAHWKDEMIVLRRNALSSLSSVFDQIVRLLHKCLPNCWCKAGVHRTEHWHYNAPRER